MVSRQLAAASFGKGFTRKRLLVTTEAKFIMTMILVGKFTPV